MSNSENLPNLQIPGLSSITAGLVEALSAESHDSESNDAWQDDDNGDFTPREPHSLEETGLTELDIEALVMKRLHAFGPTAGRELASHLRLPFSLVGGIMARLKNQMLVGHKSDALAGDYRYQLTPSGVEKAAEYMGRCTYCGAAPVGLREYRRSVEQQKLRNYIPTPQDLATAYDDMMLTPAMIAQVGQAISAGRSLFLYGPPGNGKTSIAERAMRAIGGTIWIPRLISIAGQIIRVYDSNCHEALPIESSDASHVDDRWIRIRRPTVVVGGELDMHHLELTTNTVTGVSEAPIQLKSNCGCLVVDDFGRQRVSESELLNRWIIPLEKGYDILNLPTGSRVQFPFEQLLVFSTNMKPHELCDEAFLRRIPYKVEVTDPSEKQFTRLFLRRAKERGMECQPELVEYLLDRHFRDKKREVRYCHADALLQQVSDFCRFHRVPLEIDKNRIDFAAVNYFSGT